MRSLRSSSMQTDCTFPFVVLEYYGGAAGRVPSDLPWDILFIAQWTDSAQTNMHRDSARSGEERLRPFSENAHLLSALEVEAEDAIKTAFAANSQRLAAVKAKYDSTNFLRVNHNIKPETQAATA
jgi:uncharacterized protein YfdQ (DUF2303 family)